MDGIEDSVSAIVGRIPMSAIRASVMVPYVAGLVSAAVLHKVGKPVLREVMKAGLGIVLELRRLAAEAGEELQDITAEVYAEALRDETETAAKTLPTTA